MKNITLALALIGALGGFGVALVGIFTLNGIPAHSRALSSGDWMIQYIAIAAVVAAGAIWLIQPRRPSVLALTGLRLAAEPDKPKVDAGLAQRIADAVKFLKCWQFAPWLVADKGKPLRLTEDKAAEWLKGPEVDQERRREGQSRL